MDKVCRMKNMMRTVAGLLAAAMAMCGHAQDLKTVKDIYEKNSEAIRGGFQPKFESLQQQYVNSLEALKASAQGWGDLEKTKAAIKEIERFAKMKSLPAALDEKEMPEIKTFQSAYVSQYNRLEMDMVIQLGALTEKYAQALDRQLKELTKAGKLDAATVVLEEKKKALETVKGYAETLAALKGTATTNGTAIAVSLTGNLSPAPPSWKTDANKSGSGKDLYLVIDLSGGKDAEKYPVIYLADVPKGGWTDEYKTEKLVMRWIGPGTFRMGSPEDEPGRKGNETQHKVTLTRAFYIGVFEVTQGQWERVTGNAPSTFKGPILPVESVCYNDIRGSSAGAAWPTANCVDVASFMGTLRTKTGLAALDLPTEAQWEYACRTGTDKPYAEDLDELAWYEMNSGKMTHPAGQKRPNEWGLYDMHGNVWEWCLDWKGESSAENTTDPAGAVSGSERMRRGGSWNDSSKYCRSANRGNLTPGHRNCYFGFRAAMPLP